MVILTNINIRISSIIVRFVLLYPSRRGARNWCCFDAGQTSQTGGRRRKGIDTTSRACWDRKSPYSNWIVCNAIEIDIKFHIKKYWQRMSTFSNDNIYTYMENIELSKSNKKRGQPALELLLKVMGREMLGISF